MDIRNFFGGAASKSILKDKLTNKCAKSIQESEELSSKVNSNEDAKVFKPIHQVYIANTDLENKAIEIDDTDADFKFAKNKKRKGCVASSDEEIPTNSECKKDYIKKSKLKQNANKVDNIITVSDSDDSPKSKNSKRKSNKTKKCLPKKPKLSEKKKNDIFDSDSGSDEDPLPREIREKVKKKQKGKRFASPTSDSIEKAFGQIPKTSIKKAELFVDSTKHQKQYVDAISFFGPTPVHQKLVMNRKEQILVDLNSKNFPEYRKDDSNNETKSLLMPNKIDSDTQRVLKQVDASIIINDTRNKIDDESIDNGVQKVIDFEKSINKSQLAKISANSLMVEKSTSQDIVSNESLPSTSQLSSNISCPSKHSAYVSQCSQLTASPMTQSISKNSLLWVDKYHPVTSKQIIGQQGDKSNAKKLLNWLLNWNKYYSKKSVYTKGNNDGCGMKAALLSGPPGIGKTTTAKIICKEAGFSHFELNASDTRSKKSLKDEISEATNSQSLMGYFTKNCNEAPTKKHCLIMDEVDGMAGNEDRGGVAELILLIKSTRIPFICICNDRNHPKMRSLANYCFDLRFQRPRIDQIKGVMMSIAFKEGIKLPGEALNEIIISANHDIRQIIHNLNMWTVQQKQPNASGLQEDAKKVQRDLSLGPFDVCKKVFSREDGILNINSGINLFFQDYSIGPLFVQENYLSVNPHNSNNIQQTLELIKKAASSIAIGDIVDNRLRKGQAWSLLPTQAIFSNVIPGSFMQGHFSQMIQFPQWLGKNSSRLKNYRLLQDLSLHTSLNISANRFSLNQDYLPYMRRLFSCPLIVDGAESVNKVISQLNAYNLLREDLDSIFDLTNWPNSKNINIPSNVKSALTRAYNKNNFKQPFATIQTVGKGKKRISVDEEMEEDNEEEDADTEKEEEDIKVDSMVKKEKSTDCDSA